MPEVLLRPMRPDDVDPSLDVFATVAAEGLWLGTEAGFDRASRRALWLADLDDPSTRTIVVVRPRGGRMLGHGRVRREPYGVAGLGMVLAAEARGRGIGGRLLDRLLVEAADLGAHKVDLQVWPHNEPALRLYLSRGFQVEGRVRSHYLRTNGQLWDAVIMGRPMPAAPGVERPVSGLPDAASLPSRLCPAEGADEDDDSAQADADQPQRGRAGLR